MSVINGIDYDNLARMAEQHRVPFHVLCERAEMGRPLLNKKVEDLEWIGYQMAAEILGSTYQGLASLFTYKCELDYWGIEWKTKSMVKPKGKRGCGVLFKRADIVIVKNIRDGAKLSLIAALKVFQAMEQGKI